MSLPRVLLSSPGPGSHSRQTPQTCVGQWESNIQRTNQARFSVTSGPELASLPDYLCSPQTVSHALPFAVCVCVCYGASQPIYNKPFVTSLPLLVTGWRGPSSLLLLPRQGVGQISPGHWRVGWAHLGCNSMSIKNISH